ncbi:MAG: IS5 family transposase [Gammaproteobacteria bacterium]|nr:IS5 family transposase [Gammaproteobacteria bacterium]
MSWPKEKPFNRYPSDLTDAEWERVQPLLEEREPNTRGRPREVDLREILNAIFYINKTGCQWRYLPKDFPAYTTVSTYYHQWINNGVFEKINTALHQKFRQEVGRNETPSAAIIDSQSVKGTQECADETGFDGGKLVKGRKRHILVDTMGCLIYVGVHAANIPDVKGAPQVLQGGLSIANTIRKVWADGAYQGESLAQWLEKNFNCTIEVVNKNKEEKGFQVLPRRWVVERSLAWLGRSRRLSRDYERKPASSQSQVYLASIRLMLRKIFKNRELLQEPILEAA